MFKALEVESNNKGYNLYPDEESGTYITNYLQDLGIHKVVLRKQIVKEKYIRPYLAIEMQLNPKRLIEHSNNIKITKDKDIVKISNEFNKIVKSIDECLPEFYYWTLKRIDYATYVITDYVKEYIQLFQRADRPSNHFKELYDIKSKRRKQLEGSFYLYSRGTAINFYDKEFERRENQKKYNLPNDDIKNAKNILRIEIQCNKSKTDYMKSKLEFETKNLFYFLNLDISRDTILYYYKKTIGEGDYYTLNKAREIINNSKYSLRKKHILIQVLELINTKRSIWKARNEFIKSNATFNSYLKDIRGLGINPVTIPRNKDIEFLENVISKIEKQMINN